MNPLNKAYLLAKYLGPGWMATRVRLALQHKLGATRRLYKTRPWDQIGLAEILKAGTPTDPEAYVSFKRSQAIPFLYPLGSPPDLPAELRSNATRNPSFKERLDLAREMRAVYFFRSASREAIDWYHNPLTGGRSQPGPAWCDLPDFGDEQGDVRTLWEPARAAWALDAMRSEEPGKAADIYWQWLDSWMQACPPWTGVQWKCGQEASVRFIALGMAFWALADQPSLTAERFAQFARVAWATGHRVYHHLDYAVSQKNNHAISEATGLIFITQLFPELRDASKWRRQAWKVLDQEMRRQVYADGSYVQHSLNYQRVMMDGALLALRLGELAKEPGIEQLRTMLGRCSAFVGAMIDPQSGHAPNYGNNDGAYVLPLSECDFRDFRPVVQATHYFATGTRRYQSGPWDEQLLWLFGADALGKQIAHIQDEPLKKFESGGYYTLNASSGFAFVRAHTYRDRPGQRDQFHVDLFVQGNNVLRDCGTYQYFTPKQPSLASYFKSPSAHNVVQVGEGEPVVALSRFLSVPWPIVRGSVTSIEEQGLMGWLIATHQSDGAQLRERALLSDRHERFAIFDIFVSKPKPFSVSWHLPAVPQRSSAHQWRLAEPSLEIGLFPVRDRDPSFDRLVELEFAQPEALSSELCLRTVEGAEADQLGACGFYYGHAEPDPVLVASGQTGQVDGLITIIAPSGRDLSDWAEELRLRYLALRKVADE